MKKKGEYKGKKWVAHFKRAFGRGRYVEMRPSWVNKVWGPLSQEE